jgi:hypothetical protein
MRSQALFLASPLWVMSFRLRVRFRTILLGGLLTALSARELPAAIINVADGDVAGLIAAINTANTNGQSDVINLAANGTYTLAPGRLHCHRARSGQWDRDRSSGSL